MLVGRVYFALVLIKVVVTLQLALFVEYISLVTL
jgi:hypothetical protein